MHEYPKILIVGTGLSAQAVKQWNLDGWTVAVMNRAWELLPDRWDWFFYCRSFKDKLKPKRTGLQVMNRDYCRIINDDKYCWDTGIRQTTMVFVAHYCLDHKPLKMGFIGCDLNYTPDAEGNNTTYGVGKPDAAELPKEDRQIWNAIIADRAELLDCEIVNFSTVESDLPFKREAWPNGI
jgi:hypothetical protein